jgi:hypothetical protein
MLAAPRTLATLAILLALTTPCHGHDLWLIPPEKAEVGKTLTIRANVGMTFPDSEVAPDLPRYRKRLVHGPDGRVSAPEIAGKDGTSGLLQFEPKEPGIYAVTVETNPKVITLEADRFNEYLVTDGLLHIFRLRAKEKSLDQPGKERYSKSPKTLLRVGNGFGGNPTKPLDLPLEIVPLHNPFEVRVGETLPVRVLFQGKPLPEANLGWQHPGDGDTPRGSVRTDAKGEALIPVARVGLMTIRLTHMTRPKTADYEWESFWTTLTFRVP